MRTFYMLRNTFLALAVLSVLVAAAPSQAATTLGAAGDSKTSVAYNAATGGFTLQPDGQAVGLFDIQSATGIFTGSVTLPNPGLGLNVDTASRKSWAALPAQAVNTDFNLGVLAATGLTQAFLLGDLSLVGSGGFGTTNRDFDLVYTGAVVGTPPVFADVSLGTLQFGGTASRQLTATGDPAPTFGSLTPVGGTAATAATLTSGGLFSWNSAGSAPGLYSWNATATNPSGSDVGLISVQLIPEPATVSLIGLAFVAAAGFFRRSR
jgi:hypothetical protein